MAANGQLGADEVTRVQTGTFAGRDYEILLSNPTANAWGAMKLAAAEQHVALSIAPPDGGYRDLHVQGDLLQQWLGKPHEYDHGLNPGSGARPANPGHSNHGLGICLDVIGDMTWVRRNMATYGFRLPLANDPNHLQHNGITAIAFSRVAFLSSKESTVHAFYLTDAGGNRVPNTGVVLPDGSAPNSTSDLVYDARVQYLRLASIGLPAPLYNTELREAWRDFNRDAALRATAVASALQPTRLTRTQVQDLADSIAANMPVLPEDIVDPE